MESMLEVVWFKRDLRVADHAALAAVRGPVLPLYIIEPEYWRGADASPRQWRFLRGALTDLRAQLAAIGLPLVVRKGDAVTLLARLHAERGIRALHSHEETGNLWTYARDRAVARFCREAGIAWHEAPQFGVVRRLASRDGWARRWAGLMGAPRLAAPQGLRAPEVIEGALPAEPLDWAAADGLVEAQPPGRAEGLALLDSFLAGRGADYRRGMSSPLSAAGACSRLSPHLAVGSVSMREVVQRVQGAAREIAALPPGLRPIPLGAVQSLSSRLHWHCHFIQKLEAEPEIEFRNVHRGFDGVREPHFDNGRFECWRKGETGFPLIDACMKMLAETGWINFRMRALLVSFSSYQLWNHWREPALHLAREFLDYEPGIHYPQIQMQSGVTGINTLRIYNPVKQAQDQDPQGIFVRRWLPALQAVPNAWLFEPWTMPPDVQQSCGVIIGEHYPQPVVDHLATARHARDTLWALRRDADVRAEARRVFDKHGSRNPQREGRSKRAAKPAQKDGTQDSTPQLSLGLE